MTRRWIAALPYVAPPVEDALLAACVSWYDYGPSNVFLDARANNTLIAGAGSPAPDTTPGNQFQGNVFNNRLGGTNWMRKNTPAGMADFGTTGFTLVSWNKGQMTNGIVARWDSGQQSFCLHGNTTGSAYDHKFYVSSNGSNSTIVTLGAVTNGNTAWHFNAGWYDPLTAKIYGRLDAGAVAELAFAGPLNIGTSPLIVGGLLSSGAGVAANILDSTAIFNRPLTTDELNYLYNGGLGRHSSEIGL